MDIPANPVVPGLVTIVPRTQASISLSEASRQGPYEKSQAERRLAAEVRCAGRHPQALPPSAALRFTVPQHATLAQRARRGLLGAHRVLAKAPEGFWRRDSACCARLSMILAAIASSKPAASPFATSARFTRPAWQVFFGAG